MQKKSFKIDSSIYSEDAIILSIEEFQDFWDIIYKSNELSILSKDDNIDEIFNEFMNYVIWIQCELI